MFTLHDRLAADTFFVLDSALSSVLLMNNQLFPWLVLVPRIANAREIIDLSRTDQHRLMDEMAKASHIMRELFTPDKLNVAALGNQVPQLHIHVIARFTSDTAWPNPVWGGKRKPYEDPTITINNVLDYYQHHA